MQLIGLVLTAAIFLAVLAVGMRVAPGDLPYVLRKPARLVRSLLAMNVLAPIAAVVICRVFSLHSAVVVALVTLALAPVGALFSKAMLPLVAQASYARGLFFASTVLSVIVTPLAVDAIDVVFGENVHVKRLAVAQVVVGSVLLPLCIGVAIGRWWPAARRWIRAIERVSSLVLLVCAVAIIVGALSLMASVVRRGTLTAIAIMTLIGLAVGDVLGGPDEDDRTALAFARVSHHPGIAMAGASLTDQPLAPIGVLLAVLVSELAVVPYKRWRKRLCTAVAATVLVMGLALPAAAQVGAQTTQTSPAPAEARDPLGRETPRGTIVGFNLAVHREDFVSAVRYMQILAAQDQNAERLARDLADLIDRYFTEPITALSDAPDGASNDGQPFDRERVVLRIADKPVDIGLVRVKDPQAGLVWLISSQTLAEVPALRQSAGVTWLERLMPEALVDATLFGVPIARWFVWAATIVIPFAALSLLSAIVIVFAGRMVTDATRHPVLDAWYRGLRWPVISVLTLGIHLALMPVLGFSLRFRVVSSRIALAAAVVAATWLVWRFLALSFADARIAAQRRGKAGIRSLLLLAERVCKAVIILVAIFALLKIAGVDTTTALAGVGIGGVAVALGAQKSVENLLGGVFLIIDRALAIGDTCSISNRVGVVEDITMRSVRLRTTEQTLLSVPAGILSQSILENFATREKILVQSTLRLQYDTTADQLKRLLTSIRALLDAHPDIETSTARIRLVDFGERAIELELFAYVMTRDALKFLAVREDLLLQVATIVESSGTSFAQATHVHHEPAADPNVGVHSSGDGGAVSRRSPASQGT